MSRVAPQKRRQHDAETQQRRRVKARAEKEPNAEPSDAEPPANPSAIGREFAEMGSASANLVPGARVRIRGLTKRPELNGAEGATFSELFRLLPPAHA